MIFGASTDLLSAAHTGQILEPFFRWICPGISGGTIDLLHLAIRKGAHLTEYAILALLLRSAIGEPWRQAGKRLSWRITAVAFVLSAIYAASDEFHQSFVPSRSASVRDVLIDMCGAAIGLSMLMGINSLAEKLARVSEGDAV
jgi:VanZ family protein